MDKDDEKALESLVEASILYRHKGQFSGYPARLNEPVFIDPAKWGDDSRNGVRALVTGPQRAYRQKIDAIIEQRWNDLFYLYGIDLTGNPAAAWEALARALVTQHVPGFRVVNIKPQKKACVGAPEKWSTDAKNRLLGMVMLARLSIAAERKPMKNAKQITVTMAIDRLMKQRAFKDAKLPGVMSKANLEKRHSEFMKEIRTGKRSVPFITLSNIECADWFFWYFDKSENGKG